MYDCILKQNKLLYTPDERVGGKILDNDDMNGLCHTACEQIYQQIEYISSLSIQWSSKIDSGVSKWGCFIDTEKWQWRGFGRAIKRQSLKFLVKNTPPENLSNKTSFLD